MLAAPSQSLSFAAVSKTSVFPESVALSWVLLTTWAETRPLPVMPLSVGDGDRAALDLAAFEDDIVGDVRVPCGSDVEDAVVGRGADGADVA